jgi:hypothetical protein
MNKFFLLIISGLLLHIIPCSGSPLLLLQTGLVDFQQSIQIIDQSGISIDEKSGIPEGFNAIESTGIIVKENKRLVAALLTLTLGMLGVHRIYMGSKPWIPLVYLLTFGGGFFILPLIDLIAILTTPDIDKYLDNPRVFMWIEPEEKKRD